MWLCATPRRQRGTFMETPVEIDYQGMVATGDLRDAITRRLQQFEERFGRITAGRVALKTPSGHHHTGGLFEINIHLALPDGSEVNVGHTRQDDRRYADLHFALNHNLQASAPPAAGQGAKAGGTVKSHWGQSVGIVRQLDPLGEFGFIETSEGREIYFHRNSVLNGDFSRLTVNARVSYAEEEGDKGPQASTVRLL